LCLDSNGILFAMGARCHHKLVDYVFDLK